MLLLKCEFPNVCKSLFVIPYILSYFQNGVCFLQIHSLLELVKQEQNIYNIVFNEVIRQVSIECVERGELLAELRKRYAKLLDRIPRQVKRYQDHFLEVNFMPLLLRMLRLG